MKVKALLDVCPLCSSNQQGPLYQIFSGENIWACRKCGLQYLFPQPNDEDLNRIYLRAYYNSWGWDCEEIRETVNAMKRKTFNRYLSYAAKYAPSGNLLDVGCAFGALLEVAKARGWKPYGVEISTYACQSAREKFGDSIKKGAFENVVLPENYFSVIVMSDLLEHTREPMTVLEKANRLLRKGGILLIITPNTNSFSSKVMRSRWTHYKKEHLFYFSPVSISNFLIRSGFRVLLIRPAVKLLSVDYIYYQFKSYKHSIITPILSILTAVIPHKLRQTPLPILEGDMLVVGKKEE